MEIFKNLKISCLFFVMLIAVVACNKEESLNAETDVVFLKKKDNNNNTVYGVAYYLQANQGLNSATVTLPNGQVFALKQHETSSYLFWHEPDNSEFSPSTPVAGNYIFKIESKKGESLEIIEEQKFDGLPFAEIEKWEFDNTKENKWLYVKWGSVLGADAYAVMLMQSSGKVIFNSIPIIGSDTNEFIMSEIHLLGTWSGTPVYNQKYILKINAIKYDNNTINYFDPYNVQEVSETLRDITWELN